MKRFFSSLALALALGLIGTMHASAQLAKWKEGTHYDVISETASKKPVVKEYFSFFCPACYQFEPLVVRFKDAIPEGTKFEKIHVNFMGSASREIQSQLTRAMIVGRAMKDEETYNAAIFNYIHKQRAPITSMGDVRSLFIVNGADGEKFDKLAKSFGVNSLVKKNNKAIDDFREHVTGVPTFIVNDKF
jgi:thiol:disulfide interchange protein DsbA